MIEQIKNVQFGRKKLNVYNIDIHQDGIIEEIDEDGSGTMDFDEFCQMMMS